MSIPTDLVITVYADTDYHYSITCGGEFQLSYNEDGLDHAPNIGFGSLAEMEAVANAMLQAVKAARSLEIS